MYKYDIPSSKGNQYTLLYNGTPINVAKSITYLKAKMKAHRDDVGSEEEGTYIIVAPNGSIIYDHEFSKGEKGNGKTSYHVIEPKPNINYKTVYMYDAAEPITETERKDTFPITTYEVICDSDGTIITDLTLLKFISDILLCECIPVMVTKKVLVGMATYMPLNKESFVKLSGAGEKLYEKCGERFISAIKEYLDKKESQGKW